MDFTDYKRIILQLKVGKKLPTATYLHVEALASAPGSLITMLDSLREKIGIGDEFNVIKFGTQAFRISFLAYPRFFELPHPKLTKSVLVDLASGKVREEDYTKRANRPILHRKEAFLPADHPKVSLFSSMTKAEEETGLYENTRTIGFDMNWERLLQEKGLSYKGHKLIQAATQPDAKTPPATTKPHWKIPRHKTAITRRDLSKPIKTLLHYGLLSKNKPILDYGCGLGGDVEGLQELGYDIHGWDPYFSPQTKRSKSPVVNIGFVLNVIEDPAERVEVLHDAWSYAKDLLAVTTLVAGGERYESIQILGDGFLTKTGTFQKYFEQSELQSLIEHSLDAEAVPANLGVFLVFRKKEDRQRFLFSRTKRSIDWEGISQRLGLLRAVQSVRKWEVIIEQNRELLEAFWERMAELGRMPKTDEFAQIDQVRKACGSLPAAMRLFVERYGQETLAEVREKRKEDLMVALASYQFRKKTLFKSLATDIQNDIRGFFGSYTAANEACKQLLFTAGDPGELMLAIEELDYGWIDEREGHFTIHRSLLDQLPVILRVYIECGCQLYGNPYEADLIKIHIHSRKLTLIHYDDFDNKHLPELKLRIKIDLRNLFVNVFDYKYEERTQILFFRDRFVGSDHPELAKMQMFSKRLNKHGFGQDKLGPNDRNVPSKEQLAVALSQLGLTWDLKKKRKREV